MRRRLFWWGERYEDWCLDHLPDRLTDNFVFAANERMQLLACRLLQHTPINDQCGRPEHDFCVHCRKTLPGQGSS